VTKTDGGVRPQPQALQFLLVALILLAMGAVIISISFTAARQRESVIESQEEALRLLAGTTSAEIDDIFDEISFTFSTLDTWILSHPAEDPRFSSELASYADAFRRSVGGLVDIRLISASGGLYYLPSASRTPLADVSDRPYFRVQLDPATRGLVIGDTFKSRLTGEWGIPVSYPLSSRGSGMAVILAVIDMAKLLDSFEDVRPSANGSVLLLKEDGIVLARTPFEDAYIGARLPLPGQLMTDRYGQNSGALVSPERGPDGVDRTFAFRRIPNLGLVVAVSVENAKMLAGWRSTLPGLVLGGALLVLLICLMAARLFLILRDLGRARKSLEENVHRLEENRAAKDRLFSIISHDLRGPVGGIKSLLETLTVDRKRMSDRELGQGLEALAGASSKTYQLLEDLLAWSRAERGLMVFSPHDLPLPAVVDESIAALQAQAAAKSVRIEAAVAEGAAVRADLDMIRTILRNLISNAIKYSPIGSRVLVEGLAAKGGVKIAVTDEGAGMDEETLASLFDVAAMHSRPGTAGETGTGLGLQVVKDFMERHGGRVSARSESGRGSSFELFFPASQEPSGK
jgi:signal transduction histidine kinase